VGELPLATVGEDKPAPADELATAPPVEMAPADDEEAEVKAQPKRYYVVLFQSSDPDDPFGDLNRFLFHFVKEELDKKVITPANQTELDVWIDSPGGSATVAYKLFLELRHRCCKLRMIVPDYAKSAATLLVLGGDEIFMSASAELGPLDAQIEHPDREGVTVSALEVAGAFEFMGRFAADYAVSSGGEILKWTELPRSDVLREFLAFSAKFLKPAMAKLDPHMIYRAKNQLDLAHKYAEVMLKKRLVGTEELPSGFSGGLADHLVRHYPAHEYLISSKEAEELKLPIEDAESYSKWDEVYKLHTFFRRRQFAGVVESIIEVWDDSDLDSEFGEDGDNEPGDGTKPAGDTGFADFWQKGDAHEDHKTSDETAVQKGESVPGKDLAGTPQPKGQ